MLFLLTEVRQKNEMSENQRVKPIQLFSILKWHTSNRSEMINSEDKISTVVWCESNSIGYKRKSNMMRIVQSVSFILNPNSCKVSAYENRFL